MTSFDIQPYSPALTPRQPVPVRPQPLTEFLVEGELLEPEAILASSATTNQADRLFTNTYDALRQRSAPRVPLIRQEQLEQAYGGESANPLGGNLDLFA